MFTPLPKGETETAHKCFQAGETPSLQTYLPGVPELDPQPVFQPGGSPCSTWSRSHSGTVSHTWSPGASNASSSETHTSPHRRKYSRLSLIQHSIVGTPDGQAQLSKINLYVFPAA